MKNKASTNQRSYYAGDVSFHGKGPPFCGIWSEFKNDAFGNSLFHNFYYFTDL